MVEQDYKQLTTDPGQRESFRAHIINAVQNSLAPEKAFADAAIEWYEANAHRIDTERNLTLNLPPLKDKIKLEAADAEAVEKTKHILREIKGCEIFNNDELGLKHCFKYVFATPFLKSAERTFMHKVFELEEEITLEQAAKQLERHELREKMEIINGKKSKNTYGQTDRQIFEAKKSIIPAIRKVKEKLNEIAREYLEIKNKESKTSFEVDQMGSLKYQYNHYRKKYDELKMSLKEKRDYWYTFTEDDYNETVRLRETAIRRHRHSKHRHSVHEYAAVVRRVESLSRPTKK